MEIKAGCDFSKSPLSVPVKQLSHVAADATLSSAQAKGFLSSAEDAQVLRGAWAAYPCGYLHEKCTGKTRLMYLQLMISHSASDCAARSGSLAHLSAGWAESEEGRSITVWGLFLFFETAAWKTLSLLPVHSSGQIITACLSGGVWGAINTPFCGQISLRLGFFSGDAQGWHLSSQVCLRFPLEKLGPTDMELLPGTALLWKETSKGGHPPELGGARLFRSWLQFLWLENEGKSLKPDLGFPDFSVAKKGRLLFWKRTR